MMYLFEELSAADGKIVSGWLAHKAVKRWIFIDDWDVFFAWANQNPDRYLFKASIDGKMLGVIDLEIEGEHGFISMTIDPVEHNKGYGKRLLRQFLREAQRLTRGGLTAIEAGIFPENTGSVRCFTACGFQSRGNGDDGELRYEYTL